MPSPYAHLLDPNDPPQGGSGVLDSAQTRPSNMVSEYISNAYTTIHLEHPDYNFTDEEIQFIFHGMTSLAELILSRRTHADC